MRASLFSGCLLAALLSGGACAIRVAAAAPPVAHGAVLVELFTSEGCSSCPPADDLLRQINGKDTAAGQLIVGISEHVTYWNRLGWADPYSSDAYTQRQSAYGARFGLDSVYTPQMVIDGQAQVVGSDEAALRRALAAESAQKQVDLRIVSDQISGGALTVRFTAHGISAGHALNVMAVVTDDKDRSNVLRGENAGRALQHVAVARVFVKVATIHGDGEQTVHIALPTEAFATSGAGHHLILFAQRGQAGQVMGMDTKPL